MPVHVLEDGSTVGLGWIPDAPDHRDLVYKAAPGLDIPPKGEVKDPSPVRNQGALGSCTGFAVKNAAEIAAWKNRVKVSLSALHLYIGGRAALGTVPVDSGAMIRDVVKYANREGACSSASWPYDTAQFAVWPPKDALEQGRRHPLLTYQQVNTHLDARQALWEGSSVVYGVSLYKRSFGLAGSTGILGPILGGDPFIGAHAMILVAWDDNRAFPEWGTRGGFFSKNSWGNKWGAGGYYWMPYAAFDRPDVQDAWAISTMDTE